MFGDKFLNRGKENDAVEDAENLDNVLDDIAVEADEGVADQEFMPKIDDAGIDLSDFNFDEMTASASEKQNQESGDDILEQDDFSDLNLDDFSLDSNDSASNPAETDITLTTETTDDILDDFNFSAVDGNAELSSQNAESLNEDFNNGFQSETDEIPDVEKADEMSIDATLDSTNLGDKPNVDEPVEERQPDVLDDFNFDQISDVPTVNEAEAAVVTDSNISGYSEETYDEIGVTADVPDFDDASNVDVAVTELAAVSTPSSTQGQEGVLDAMAMEKMLQNNLRWYSGSLNDAYFEVSVSSSSQDFIGNEDCSIIHVNVGTETYGWNVLFENGVLMSLRDLRIYQSKYGQLPDVKGSILYGDLEINFDQITKIVVYESAQYFSYGYPES